jgi:hypothetical protein
LFAGAFLEAAFFSTLFEALLSPLFSAFPFFGFSADGEESLKNFILKLNLLR